MPMLGRQHRDDPPLPHITLRSKSLQKYCDSYYNNMAFWPSWMKGYAIVKAFVESSCLTQLGTVARRYSACIYYSYIWVELNKVMSPNLYKWIQNYQNSHSATHEKPLLRVFGGSTLTTEQWFFASEVLRSKVGFFLVRSMTHHLWVTSIIKVLYTGGEQPSKVMKRKSSKRDLADAIDKHAIR